MSKTNHKQKPSLNFDDEDDLYGSSQSKSFSASLAKINSKPHGNKPNSSQHKVVKIRHEVDIKQAVPAPSTAKDDKKANGNKVPLKIKKLENAGWKYFCDKKYEKAIECYDQIIEIDPHYKPAFINKAFAANKYGQLLLKQDNFVKAEYYLGMALAIQPKSPFVHHSLGNLYQYKTEPDYDKATYHYKQALVNAYRHEKFHKEYTEQQLALLPRHALKIYLENEDYKSAEQYVELVDKYASKDEISLARVAELKSKLGYDEEARTYSNRAVEVLLKKLEENTGDKNIDAKLFSGKLFIHNVSALQIFLVAIEREEDNAANWKSLGVNLSSNHIGYKPDAVKCLDVAIVLNPNDSEALYYKICLLKDMGYIKYAFELCRSLLEIYQKQDIGDHKLYRLLASLETLDAHEFSPLYKQLIGDKANMVETLIAAGQSLYAIDKLDEAISKYNQALRINPDPLQSSFIICYKAVAKIGKKQYDGAIKLLDQALDMASSNEDIIYGYKGLALLLSKKYIKAKICFEQAIKIKEQNLLFFYRGITEIFNPSQPDDVAQTFKDFRTAYKVSSKNYNNIVRKTKLLLEETLSKAGKFLPDDYQDCPNIIEDAYIRLFKTIWNMRVILKQKIAEFKTVLANIPEKILKSQKLLSADIINKITMQIEGIDDSAKPLDSTHDLKESEVELAGSENIL
mgnify:CR=1 FL=1